MRVVMLVRRGWRHFSILPSQLNFVCVALAALVGATATSLAQNQVYFQNFDTDDTANWTVNSAGNYSPANIFFDYSTVGVPSAPNSTNGTTRGLKVQANLDVCCGVFPSGVSASPMGFSITDNFEMRWDWWLNYNGPLNGGGSGSTQIGGAGFGTAATFAQVPTAIDSVFVGCSGDGTGTSADYRVYTPAFTASLQDASGVYAAGTVGSRNNTHAYYQSTFPPVSATNNCPAQLALYPQQTGLTQGGSAGMRWNDISLKKLGNIITYTINGLLIATIDVSTNGTLGGANIVFGHFDINSSVSTDVNATNLAFSLVDNVRITNFANVVAATATQPNASEAGPVNGTITITRTASGTPLTVNYTMSGTAISGTDYTALPGSVTFGATATSTNIDVVPIDDSIAEFAETVILTVNESTNYVVGDSAVVTIADNENATFDVSALQASAYESVTNDYITFRLERRGDVTTGPFTVNLTYGGGTATSGVDFVPTSSVNVDGGVVFQNFAVNPIDDSLLEGDETVVVNVANGTGYNVGTNNPSATGTILDNEVPTETVLFSDNFNTDSSANWIFLWASTNNAPEFADYTTTFAYDYGTAQGAIPALPPAPRSTSDTLGLRIQVNKNDATPAALGVNFYPTNQSFSGNFALRFEMYMLVADGATTEYALCGINHSGTKTNWHRNTSGGVPAGWVFDGLFYSIEADGAALGDYVLFSSPTTAGNNPTALTPGRNASTLTGTFKVPPFAFAGAPANLSSSVTPSWADVEVSHIGGVVTLKINKTVIFGYTNATAYSNGNIMIGYVDGWDSIGGAAGGVIYDNVRVVKLEIQITDIQVVGSNAEVTFTWGIDDPTTAFRLQSSSTVGSGYTDTAATITKLSPGVYKATIATSGSAQFYRVRYAGQ